MVKKLSESFGISVICASRNEEIDIHSLLKSFVKECVHNSELVIIDDSEDETRNIIQQYRDQTVNECQITLVPGDGSGCCDARNKGIEIARYEIIAFMTADSFFPKNYFEYVQEKFQDPSCAALMLDSEVSNSEDTTARFIQAWHENKKLVRGEKYSPLTTQGYCVRKRYAAKVGFIDSAVTTFNVCRDWTLVKKMDQHGFKKIYDPNFKVPHIAPRTLPEFWQTHFQRGLISGGYHKFLGRRPLLYRAAFFSAKAIMSILSEIVGASFVKGHRLNRLSRQNDFLKFSSLCLVKRVAFHLGELTTLLR